MQESAHSQACLNHGSTPLITRHENTGGFYCLHLNNDKGINRQAKLCASQITQLIISHVNNRGCFTQDCLSASNSMVLIVGDSPKPVSFKDIAADVGLGNYAVIESGTSAFYKYVLSPGPYANNIQTWVDNTTNIKIQFSHLPIFPFVGNTTQLNFQVTSSNASKPLELTHIHIAVIKNAANLNNKKDFITFDNITASHGVFFVKYQFLEEGVHQVILKINTKNGEVALASFEIPVLRFWWNLF